MREGHYREQVGTADAAVAPLERTGASSNAD
jgi:hypothetical protein